MSETFFTADHHFGHRNIIRYCGRPFADVEEMDRAMVESWNAAVRPGDAVFHLGDFALGSAESIAELLATLNGYKLLVLGNHDRSAKRIVELGFDEACREADHGGGRLVHWPPPDDREPTLCGHVHGLWASRGRVINVGVDVRGYRPKTLAEVLGAPDGGTEKRL
jgi:calcineurin-like phosphoesterase family protein